MSTFSIIQGNETVMIITAEKYKVYGNKTIFYDGNGKAVANYECIDPYSVMGQIKA